MRRKERVVLFRKLLWRYELVSVLVMFFGRSNGCYGLSAKLCIYTLFFPFLSFFSFPLTAGVDLLVVLSPGIARGERRNHCFYLYGGFRIVVVRGRRGVWP